MRDTSNKSFFKDWLPPVLYYSLLELYGYIDFLRNADRKILNQNSKLENIGKGKRAFLIATGPSLKNEDLTTLQGEDCFTVSNFFLHPALNFVRPKYHFFAQIHLPLDELN